jgi:cell wall-associated NlpC family hydrolase
MSPRLLRLLPAFALVALALAAPPAISSTSALDAPSHPENRAIADAPRYRGPGERAATVALQAVGVPYRWGGESPASGFDCSGLVRWAYRQVGIEVPHSSYALYGFGRGVIRSQMEAGDVLVFSGLGHVGLYIGRGRMVHAPYSGKTVEIVRLGSSHYGQRLVAVRRVAPA